MSTQNLTKWVTVLGIVFLLIIGFLVLKISSLQDKTGIESTLEINTPRANFIKIATNDIAVKLGIYPIPRIFQHQNIISIDTFQGPARIGVSPEMLDPKAYSDDEVRFILAHEMTHIKNHDWLRFWNEYVQTWAEKKELEADAVAGQLAGCAAARSFFNKEWNAAVAAFINDVDHHPHPEQRINVACAGMKAAASFKLSS